MDRKLPTVMKRKESGYSLVEVMVAIGLLGIGVAAAASMAMTMTSSEEASTRIARAQNMHECYVRLYQLGMSPSEAIALLPKEDQVIAYTSSESTVDLGGGAIANTADLTVNFYSSEVVNIPDPANPPADATRTETISAVRAPE